MTAGEQMIVSTLELDDQAVSTRNALVLKFEQIRKICAPLESGDCCIQTMAGVPVKGNPRNSDYPKPVAASDDSTLQRCYGDVWDWTASSYRNFFIRTTAGKSPAFAWPKTCDIYSH